MRLPFASASCLGILAIPVILLAACGNSDSTTNATNNDSALSTTTTASDTTATAITAQATLSGTKADTTLSGTARFQENGGRVTLNLDISAPKMANQTVAVHIHEHGDCGDMGNGAHGHWNPTKEPHGKWGEGQFHRGDIGNISLDAQGKGSLQLDTDLWSISNSDSTRNIVNRAIIVHGGKDDYKTQPTGGAGSRIGCGVISKM